MIEVGQLTVIDFITYTCLKIEDGKAHLKDITSTQGRPKVMDVRYVPYFTDDGLIIPEKPELKVVRIPSKLNIRKILKEETEMPFTNDVVRFVVEWAETAIASMVSWAEENAEREGHSKIRAGHFYWWSLHPNQETTGYWPEQNGYASRDIYEQSE